MAIQFHAYVPQPAGIAPDRTRSTIAAMASPGPGYLTCTKTPDV
jgi:hypothetical protein